MNIKGLFFYLSLFVNKKERKIHPIYVVKTLAIKKINRGISIITKDIKHVLLNPSYTNQTDHDYNDVFIMNLVKTVTE